MAVGDYVSVIHEAGDGTTFSYTTAVDLIITNFGGDSWGALHLNNFVITTSGVGYWCSFSNNGSGKPTKLLLTSGQTISNSAGTINDYGLSVTGVEV
jgi:hypothetical protein